MSYYLRKNWKISSLVCFLQICIWGIQTAAQLLLISIFDAAMGLDFKRFIFWIFMNLLCWGIYFIFGIIQEYFQSKTVRRLNNQLRHDLYLSLLNKDYKEYHSLDSGEYISWLTNNVSQIEKLAWNPFFDCVGRVSQIIYSVLALAWIDWVLLLASLITATVMWSVPKLFDKKMEKVGAENSSAQAVAVGHLKDLFFGVDVLRLFGKKSLFLQKGDAVSDEIEYANFHLNCTKNIVWKIIGFLNVLLQIIIDILIVLLAFVGRIKIVIIVAGSSLIGSITNSFSSIADFRLSMAASKPYFMKVNIRDSSILTKDRYNSRPIIKDIVIENVSFHYGEKSVLKNVNMHLKKGGKYALVGPSGCGKTTLLKILLGWLPDYSGTIKFDDINAKDYTIEELQSQISYIEQDVFLFNSTIKENITLGEQFSKEKMEKTLRASAMSKDLASMPNGLETFVGEGGKKLSGGQKQRIAIARALIHNHSILLVDEGTSLLDEENADVVERSLLMNSNLTLVLVSHHLSMERKKLFNQVFEF